MTHLIFGPTRMTDSFMPDLKPGYNPIPMHDLMVAQGDSNDV
ncbi:hypothetical protein [Bradyrhizobium hereditatis]|nr:hypothetical protein [Bradyrhizobium hereditatis]